VNSELEIMKKEVVMVYFQLLEGLRKTMKKSVTTAKLHTKIPTQGFPNTNQEYYHSTMKFGVK
jgi:hypothetical protein